MERGHPCPHSARRALSASAIPLGSRKQAVKTAVADRTIKEDGLESVDDAMGGRVM
jgi:hypothetical protein